eukprot:GHVL01008791.1.p1 GENE.GHVL01008791.1~~GHVL01008791.1.p1  ORF type:complete len:210 (+),score=19.41 GHVL01008791.1:789-1418(+)
MSRSNAPYDYLIKLLLIGDSAVGKSCLLLRFTEDQYLPSHIATIGIDFKMKTMDIDGSRVKLQIWDTAGQERFRTVTQAYYRSAMGIILVYDVTKEESFNNIRTWIRQIESFGSENVNKILVGNKADLPKVISAARGRALAEDNGMHFFETSALSGLNVADVFYHIAKEVKWRISLIRSAGSSDNYKNNCIVVKNKRTEKEEKKKCCSQ